MAWHRLHVWWFAWVILSAAAPAATAETISGAAWVVDGDTIDIGGERLRLMSIDAPALDQTCANRARATVWYCGQEAARALWDLVGQYSVTCETSGADYTGRWFADCSVPGMNIATWMAAHGWAVPNEGCVCEEIREWAGVARGKQVGIWGSDFAMPWDWRKDSELPSQQANLAP